MKTVATRTITVWMSLMVVCLLFVGLSYARIDFETCVGLWLFDEVEGDTVKDSSDNGNDGTLAGNPEWVEGKFGNALEFDGVDDFVDCGNDESLKPPQKFTVTVWFNTEKLGGTYGRIFQSGKTWDDIAGLAISVQLDGLIFVGVARGPNNTWSLINGPALSIDRWYHVAFTSDGTNAILYLDGENVGSTTASEIHYDDNPIRIGSQSESAGGLFDGFIDEVALFNEALTEEDIKTIMTEGLESATGVSAVSPAGKLATTWSTIKE